MTCKNNRSYLALSLVKHKLIDRKLKFLENCNQVFNDIIVCISEKIFLTLYIYLSQ